MRSGGPSPKGGERRDPRRRRRLVPRRLDPPLQHPRRRRRGGVGWIRGRRRRLLRGPAAPRPSRRRGGPRHAPRDRPRLSSRGRAARPAAPPRRGAVDGDRGAVGARAHRSLDADARRCRHRDRSRRVVWRRDYAPLGDLRPRHPRERRARAISPRPHRRTDGRRRHDPRCHVASGGGDRSAVSQGIDPRGL